MAKSKSTESSSEFIIFKTEDNKISVDVRMNEQEVWLTQDQLATLYGVERPGITQHIKKIFIEGELSENSVSKKFLRTAADGKKYNERRKAVARGRQSIPRPSHGISLHRIQKVPGKTLSEAEKNYLESLKTIEQKTKRI